MGDVYEGRDLQTGDKVAIKLLKPDIVDSMPNLIERFTREGEALRQLNHPNIVKMLDAVEEDGMHYLIMEYVGGGSLEDLLQQEPQLPISQVLEIALDLADALTRAHRLKIIHRDIKPANVLLAEDGTPRLTDFGVAHMGSRTRVTETGSLIGTYSYLSPEAARSEEIDGRADIWSFGVMLYEMLAGRLPFKADVPTAVLIQILNDIPPDLAELRPDAPRPLINLINRMLMKDPAQRIPSVRQVGAELEAILQGLDTPLIAASPLSNSLAVGSRFATPTPAEPPSATQVSPAAPPSARKRWGLIAAGALLLVVIAAVGLFLLLRPKDDKTDKADQADGTAVIQVEPVQPGEYIVLVAQFEPLRDTPERDVSRFIVSDLTEVLEQDVPFSNVRIRPYPAAITSADEARKAAEANGATVMIWGRYTADLIEVEVQIGVTSAFPNIQFDRATLDRTTNVRVQLTDEQRESVATEVLGIINILDMADGNGYEVTRTVAILNEISVTTGTIASTGVSSHVHQAIRSYLDDTAQSVELYTAALALDPNALLYAYRGAAYLRIGEFDRALRDVETARRIGPDTWASPSYIMSTYHSAINAFDEAITDYNQIIDLRPDDWFAYNYRGALYYLLHDYEQAKADYARALELGPNASFPYAVLSIIAIRESRLADVEASLHTIVTEYADPSYGQKLISSTFGDQVPNVWGPTFSAMGNLLLGQYDLAVTDAQAALAVYDQFADMYFIQGLAYCNLGDYAAAEEAYTRGIDLDPDFIALYALRAEVRLYLKEIADSYTDRDVVAQSDQADTLIPLMDLGLRGEWNCTDFFSYDYSGLGS
ncbi:MAG TPA: protein kinase, partial [Aggregatilineaceae bacterium]|nr:protein kinase [Aggregatilineaceae bacterium]